MTGTPAAAHPPRADGAPPAALATTPASRGRTASRALPASTPPVRAAARAAHAVTPAPPAPRRPRLALVDSPAPAVEPAPHESGALGIARSLGATVEQDGGVSSITFPEPGAPPPYVPFDTTPRVVTRRAEPTPTASGEIAAPAPTPAPPPTVSAAPATPPAPSADELYEEVMRRLRRDLIVDREQRGELW